MKKLIYVLAIIFWANVLFAQTSTVGTCNSCLSTSNLFSKRFKIANGITSATSNTATAWAHHNTYTESASVYNNFAFKKGVEYCIEIEFELTKQGQSGFGDHEFGIRAADHLTPNSGGATPLPAWANSELIYKESYASGAFNLNQNYKLKVAYKPTADFQQIWFYVTTSTNGPTARFLVKNVDIRQQGAKAHAKFVNPKRVEQKNSRYGPIDVAVLCLNDELLVDGTGSTCENRYYVRLSEFNLIPWTDGRILHSDWVQGATQAPSNIKITDYLPQGYQLRPNKIYKFSLAVGLPWDIVDIWFKVDCCSTTRIINVGSGAIDKRKIDLNKKVEEYNGGE